MVLRVLLAACLLLLASGCISTREPSGSNEGEWFVWRDHRVLAVEPPSLLAGPTWAHRLSEGQMEARPTRAQIDRAIPETAMERELPGAVILEGRVLEDGALVWRVVSVSSQGWHFEDAAIRVGSLYRAPRYFTDGRSTAGASFVTVIGFTAVRPEPQNFE